MKKTIREEYLEDMLDQAAHCIEFLHGCLTEDNYKYLYPQMTIKQIEDIRKEVPERPSCFHSHQDPNCDGCIEQRKWMERKAKYESTKK